MTRDLSVFRERCGEQSSRTGPCLRRITVFVRQRDLRRPQAMLTRINTIIYACIIENLLERLVWPSGSKNDEPLRELIAVLGTSAELTPDSTTKKGMLQIYYVGPSDSSYIICASVKEREGIMKSVYYGRVALQVRNQPDQECNS